MIQKQEILAQLDKGAVNFEFPMLDNGYYYHGDQKMTLFGDLNRWAILIEVLQFNNHSRDIEGIMNIAAVFGNCLTAGNGNDDFYWFSQNVDTKTLLEDTDGCTFLNPGAKNFMIRNIEVSVVHERQHYQAKGIELEFDDRIMPWEFMRGLIPEHSSMFWLTREEISRSIPFDLPEIMTLSNWHHPDMAMHEKPGNTQTFQQIAEVLITGDTTFYNPDEEINTHWSYWPFGGTL